MPGEQPVLSTNSTPVIHSAGLDLVSLRFTRSRASPYGLLSQSLCLQAAKPLTQQPARLIAYVNIIAWPLFQANYKIQLICEGALAGERAGVYTAASGSISTPIRIHLRF